MDKELIYHIWKSFLNESRESLDEGLSDKLFHYTDIYKFENIIKTDRFMTSVAFANKSEQAPNRGRFYFLSTSRSPVNAYVYLPGFEYVMMNLDGRRLGHRYKGAAVDYWGAWHKTQGKSEMEDRIITDDPHIDNATSYIEEVHFAMDFKRYSQDTYSKDVLESVLGMLKHLGIPYWIYVRDQDWKLQNKAKAVTYEEFVKLFKSEGGKAREPHKPWKRLSDPNERLKALVDVIDLIKSGQKTSEDKNTKELIYRFKYYPSEQETQVSNTIHNQKTEPSARPYIQIISKFMRQNKLQTIKDFTDFATNYFTEKSDIDEADISDVSDICFTGGSTHVMKTCKIGEDQYFLKFSRESLFDSTNPSLQILVEYFAYKIYSLYPEVSIPRVELVYDSKGSKVGLASRTVKGKPGIYLPPKRLAKMMTAGVYVDILLANWDVIGMDDGNVIASKDTATRIDPGGALTFRARGGRKGRKFGKKAGELSTMLDPGMGAGSVYQYADLVEAGTVFGKVSFQTIYKMMKKVYKEIESNLQRTGMDDLLEEWRSEITEIKDTLQERHVEITKHINFASKQSEQ